MDSKKWFKEEDEDVFSSSTTNQYYSLDDFLSEVDMVVVMVKHDEIKENVGKLGDKVILDCHNILEIDNVYHM